MEVAGPQHVRADPNGSALKRSDCAHLETGAGPEAACKCSGPKGIDRYVLAHQPKSLDWRRRGACPHPGKQVPPLVFAESCDALNQIIAIGA